MASCERIGMQIAGQKLKSGNLALVCQQYVFHVEVSALYAMKGACFEAVSRGCPAILAPCLQFPRGLGYQARPH